METADTEPYPEAENKPSSESVIAVVSVCLVLTLVLLLAIIIVCRCQSRCRAYEPRLQKFSILPPPIIQPHIGAGIKNDAFKDFSQFRDSAKPKPREDAHKTVQQSDVIKKSRDGAAVVSQSAVGRSRDSFLQVPPASSESSTSCSRSSQSDQSFAVFGNNEGFFNANVPPGLLSYLSEHNDQASYRILADSSPNPTSGVDAFVIIGNPTESEYFTTYADHSEESSPKYSSDEYAHDIMSGDRGNTLQVTSNIYDSTLSTDTAAFEAGQVNKYLGANNDISVLTQSEMSINVRSCPNSPIVSRTPGFIRRLLPSFTEPEGGGVQSEPQIGGVMDSEQTVGVVTVGKTEDVVDRRSPSLRGEGESIMHSTEISTCF